MYAYIHESPTTVKIANKCITHKKCPLVSLQSLFPAPAGPSFLRQPLISDLLLQISVYSPEFYINGITQYVFFSVQFLSLRIMMLRFMLTVECISSSFIFIAACVPLYGYVTLCIFINLLMDTWCGSILGGTKNEDVGRRNEQVKHRGFLRQ